MTLLRVFSKMDSNYKIAFSRGIRKALDIKPGDKLEFTIVGINKARKLLVAKPRTFCPACQSLAGRRRGLVQTKKERDKERRRYQK